jgi:hypothetical protein
MQSAGWASIKKGRVMTPFTTNFSTATKWRAEVENLLNRSASKCAVRKLKKQMAQQAAQEKKESRECIGRLCRTIVQFHTQQTQPVAALGGSSSSLLSIAQFSQADQGVMLEAFAKRRVEAGLTKAQLKIPKAAEVTNICCGRCTRGNIIIHVAGTSEACHY